MWFKDIDSHFTFIAWRVSGPRSFCVCAQPMRDDVALQQHLSLAGRIHKMILEWVVGLRSCKLTAISIQGPHLLTWMWVGVGVCSTVVVTFNHVGRSFDLFSTTTRDVWIIPSFQIWGYVLHVEHISCVITNCGQHQWVIPSWDSIVL